MKKYLAAGVAAVALAGCSSSVTLSVPSVTPSSSSSSSATSTSTSPPTTSSTPSTDPGSQLPDEVSNRLSDSGVLMAVADTDGVHYKVTSDVIVVGNVPSSALDQLARTVSQASTAVAGLTGKDPSSKYLVLAAADDATAKAWSGYDDHLDVDQVMLDADSPWILVPTKKDSDGESLLDDTKYLRYVMQYDVFQASTLPSDVDSQGVPLWVTNGFAEWAAQEYVLVGTHQRPAAQVPTDDDFENNSAYLQAALFVRYLIGEFGQDKALAFYTAMVNGDHDTVTEGFEASFGRPYATVEAAWKRQFVAQFDALHPQEYWDDDSTDDGKTT